MRGNVESLNISANLGKNFETPKIVESDPQKGLLGEGEKNSTKSHATVHISLSRHVDASSFRNSVICGVICLKF